MNHDNALKPDTTSNIIALTEHDINVFDNVENLRKDTIRSEEYITILCLNGRATCRVEEKTVEIVKNDLFFCHPGQLIENTTASLDFKFCGLIMSPEYFDKIFLIGGTLWEAKLALSINPVIHLCGNEPERFINSHNFLRSKMIPPFGPHHKEMTALLMQSLLYEFYDYIVPKIQFVPPSYTSGEVLFGKFVELVKSQTPRQREVRYYADKLCITPKYLSAVCKQTANMTASAVINKFAIRYIKQLLRSSEKSIKEIASETGFENTSFFGKYVKRELGMSPMKYRKLI